MFLRKFTQRKHHTGWFNTGAESYETRCTFTLLFPRVRTSAGSQFSEVVPGSDEWSRVRLFTVGYRTKGWRQSMLAPFRRDVKKGVPDRRRPSQRSRGTDTSNLLLSPRTPGYIHVPLLRTRDSTHTPHVAIPEPSHRKLLARDGLSSYTKLESRVASQHVDGQFIVVFARKPRASCSNQEGAR